jgi:hypothetical protein
MTASTVSSSVEVPAVTPTLRASRNQAGSSSSGTFDLQRAQAVGEGFLGELTRVVAVAAANDDDVVAVANQIIHRGLALLRRVADGVDETHFGSAMQTFDGIDETQRDFDRMRGLRDDAELWVRRNLHEVALIKNDDGLRKVADEAAHFDVLALTDDYGLVAVANECSEGMMRLLDERTGGVDDGVTGALPGTTMFVRCPVGGDGDLLCR